MRTNRRLSTALSVLVAACIQMSAMDLSSEEPGGFFPNSFVVEHRIVQTDADGSVFTTEPVRDTYVGSRIVSERGDGGRLIIDFARRELTEIRTADGRYTVIGFDRMAQLVRELDAIERGERPSFEKSAIRDEPPRLRVIEAKTEPRTKGARVSESLANQPDVKHLRVLQHSEESGADIAVADVWFDPRFRLGSRGQAALDEFEAEVLSAANPEAVGARALAAARREAGGAVPIHSLRPLDAGNADAGTIEDMASRVDEVAAVPPELLTVPDGFQRVPHPLELMVAHARSEAELNRRMSGGGGQSPMNAQTLRRLTRFTLEGLKSAANLRSPIAVGFVLLAGSGLSAELPDQSRRAGDLARRPGLGVGPAERVFTLSRRCRWGIGHRSDLCSRHPQNHRQARCPFSPSLFPARRQAPSERAPLGGKT